MSFLESIRTYGVVTESTKLNELKPFRSETFEKFDTKNEEALQKFYTCNSITEFVINETFAYLKRQELFNPTFSDTNRNHIVANMRPYLEIHTIRTGILGKLAGFIYRIIDYVREIFTEYSDQREAYILTFNILCSPIKCHPMNGELLHSYEILLEDMRNYYDYVISQS